MIQIRRLIPKSGRIYTTTMAFLILELWLVGCGRSSVPGVYKDQNDYMIYGVGFVCTRTFDFRSDGTYVFEKDMGQPKENVIPAPPVRVEGTWTISGSEIMCMNKDGGRIATLRREGADLLDGDGNRFRRK